MYSNDVTSVYVENKEASTRGKRKNKRILSNSEHSVKKPHVPTYSHKT